jgi:hypothetical protein
MNAMPTPTSSESTSRHVDTAATRAVLIELLEERRHQVDDHGWTPDHDDLHDVTDFAWLCARRAVEICHPDAAQMADSRRVFIELGAISVAAIEMLDRRATRNGTPNDAP